MGELNLSKNIKNLLDDFTGELKKTYGSGLISVALYGSAASGEFVDKHSNINLFIVLDNTDLGYLNKISNIILKPKFRLLHILFFTEDYLRSSLDVFPIEFLDMKENYYIIYGKDILSGLEIDPKNLRFQCEQELKSKLINIKNTYLRNRSGWFLKKFLFKSSTSVLHILRNLVRLKGLKPSYLKEDVLAQFKQEFDIDTTNLNRILAAKQGNLRLDRKEINSLFCALVADIEKIIAMVDIL